MRPILLLALLVSLLAAGCAGAPPDETSRPGEPAPTCGVIATVHYERAPERDALRAAFEEAHYAWSARTDRIAHVTSVGGGVIVLSHQPGASGDDLILSATGPQAAQWVVAGAGIVNATSPDATIKEWIVADAC